MHITDFPFSHSLSLEKSRLTAAVVVAHMTAGSSVTLREEFVGRMSCSSLLPPTEQCTKTATYVPTYVRTYTQGLYTCPGIVCICKGVCYHKCYMKMLHTACVSREWSKIEYMLRLLALRVVLHCSHCTAVYRNGDTSHRRSTEALHGSCRSRCVCINVHNMRGAISLSATTKQKQ